MSIIAGYILKKADGSESLVRFGSPPVIENVYINKRSPNGNFKVVSDTSGALLVESSYSDSSDTKRIVFLSSDPPDIENAKALYGGLRDFLIREGEID